MTDQSIKQPIARRSRRRIVGWIIAALVLIPIVGYSYLYITMVDLEGGMPVENQTTHTLEIFAVDQNGDETLVNTLQPGDVGWSGVGCNGQQVARTMAGDLVARWEPSPDCSDRNTWVIRSIGGD